jgi:hypothetical protein
MSNRPAQIRQRDLKQTLLAAQKAGAKEVRVELGEDGATIVIPLVPSDDKAVVDSNEWLAGDAHQA